MGKAHSGELRERVYGEVAGGQLRRAAARRFGVSASTGVRLARRMAETGSLAPARQGRPPGGGKLAPYRELLIGWVERDGEITMPELAARLARERQVAVHPASLSRFLKAAGFTVKKTLLASEAGRDDTAPDARRAAPAGVYRRDRHHDQDDTAARAGSAR